MISSLGFGDMLQKYWGALLDRLGDDPQILWVLGSNLVMFSVYWLFAGLLTLMDITEFPKFLQKYKIQTHKSEPLELRRLWKALRLVLFNTIVLNLATSWAIYQVSFRYQTVQDIRTLPSLGRALRDIVGCFVLEELIFYYIHRLLHHKAIYKYVHKKHHEWTAPMAAITLYAHPLEHVVANVLPIGISLSVLRMHVFVAWTVFALAILMAMINHTGYSCPGFADSTRFHDFHHAKSNCNYGVVGWLDKLHGTYRAPSQKSTSTHWKETFKAILEPTKLIARKGFI